MQLFVDIRLLSIRKRPHLDPPARSSDEVVGLMAIATNDLLETAFYYGIGGVLTALHTHTVDGRLQVSEHVRLCIC